MTLGTYRFGHALGESLRRAQCPPHPEAELYQTRCYLDGSPRVACRRCFRVLAVGTLETLRADTDELASALERERML